MSNIHKCVIIGSGPAGLTAAIYNIRAFLKTIVIAGNQPGGQLTITTTVENYPGFADVIQGPWLMEQMTKQAEHVGTKIIFDHITKVDFSKRPFVAYSSSEIYYADTVIISTGAQAKWLGLESEAAFQGFGVSGCATCDGFFFRGKEVLVVGGGNTAVEEALRIFFEVREVPGLKKKPSTSELLDWLTVQFIEEGWSLKKLHRLIVLSATYRQESKLSPELRERDPDNRPRPPTPA